MPLGSCLDFPVSLLMDCDPLAEIKPFLPSLPLAMVFLTGTGEANQDTVRQKKANSVCGYNPDFSHPSMHLSVARHCRSIGHFLGPLRTILLSRTSPKYTITKAWCSWFLPWTEASVVRPRTPVFLQVFAFTPYSLPFLPQLIFPLKLEESSSQGNWAEKLMTFRGQENIPSLRRPFGLR